MLETFACIHCGTPTTISAPGGLCAECRRRQNDSASSQADPTVSSGSQPAVVTRATGRLPEQFGRYRILKQLGEGGMGSVYLAHDEQLDRPVALKIPNFSFEDGPVGRERFLREARAAAGLLHPNICPVYDAGEINGVCYLTMGYIEGRSLASVLESGKALTQRQAAQATRKIALALAEAHRHGIIHRDLKPANIMVNRRGEPVVMDFGLARRSTSEDARLTRTGIALGTPAYMAPEQAQGDLTAMGPGCDIYSLGVVLYEMLTGQLPFTGSPLSVMAQLVSDAPPRPSTKRPGLDPRLETICLRAMARQISDRYTSMDDFASALGEYSRNQSSPAEPLLVESSPVAGDLRVSDLGGLRSAALLGLQLDDRAEAAPPRPPRRKRHRRRGTPWLWVGAAALASLTGALTWLWTRPSTPAVASLSSADASPVQRNTPESAAPVPSVAKVEPRDVPKTTPDVKTAPPKRKEVIPTPLEPSLRGRARGRGRGAFPVQLGAVRVFKGHMFQVSGLALTPDGSRVLTSSRDMTLRLWRVSNGQEMKLFEGHSGAVFCVAISPDGHQALSGGLDQQLRLWNLATGECVRVFDGHMAAVLSVAFSPNGRQAASGGGLADPTLRFWNVATGQPIGRPIVHPERVTSLAFAANGRQILTGCWDGLIRIWDVAGGRELKHFKGHTGPVLCMALSPDGHQLLSGGLDHTLRLWDVNTGRDLQRFLPLPTGVLSVAFSPDGKWALSGGGVVPRQGNAKQYRPANKDFMVRLWEVGTGKEIMAFGGHELPVTAVAFTPDGRQALSSSGDRTARLWALPN
jgi:serine/threonine protein kinase